MRFLLIDHVLEFKLGERLVAVKNVTMEAQIFDQHFPGTPVFPGALLLESMAQASGYLIARSARERDGSVLMTILCGVSQARFLRAIRPGDQVLIEVRVQHVEQNRGSTLVTATVGERLMARAALSFAIQQYRGEPRFAPAVAQAEQYYRAIERQPDVLLGQEEP